MATFYESDSSPIASELVRQGFTLDRGEVLRIVDIDERASGTDTAIALGTAAISLVVACGTLALSGFTLPILAPIAALGYAGLTAWNSRATKQEREFEAEFLHRHPEFVEAVNQKLKAGEESDRVAAAYEQTLKAFITGDAQRMKSFLPAVEMPIAMAPYPVEEMSIAMASPIGNTTRLGAVDVAIVESSSALPTNKTELLARLKVECPVLLKLVKSQPIRAVGTQRTGKTTLVKKLALLRSLALPNHKVIASTPHYEPENPYPSVFQVVGVKGGKRDYPAIARQWEAMATRIENGDRSSITTIWDEYGLFDKVVEEETLTSVLTSSLREATKHGEFPVFIVHGETQAFLPGSRGLVTVFLSSTVRVETIGQLVTGADGLDEMRPTGKFRVQWLDGTKEEGQIPKWLSEEFLISLLPNSVATNNQPETYQEKPAESPTQADEPDDDAPEIGLNQPSVAEVKAQKKELFELGQAILELLQKNPDKSYSDESIRTNRFIETTTGKRPSLITVRASISAVSKLHYVSVDKEGRIQWNQPS